MLRIDWTRRAAEYALGAGLLLSHLALSGRVVQLVDPLVPPGEPDGRPALRPRARANHERRKIA